jgi:hypothetical protein
LNEDSLNTNLSLELFDEAESLSIDQGLSSLIVALLGLTKSQAHSITKADYFYVLKELKDFIQLMLKQWKPPSIPTRLAMQVLENESNDGGVSHKPTIINERFIQQIYQIFLSHALRFPSQYPHSIPPSISSSLVGSQAFSANSFLSLTSSLQSSILFTSLYCYTILASVLALTDWKDSLSTVSSHDDVNVLANYNSTQDGGDGQDISPSRSLSGFLKGKGFDHWSKNALLLLQCSSTYHHLVDEIHRHRRFYKNSSHTSSFSSPYGTVPPVSESSVTSNTSSLVSESDFAQLGMGGTSDAVHDNNVDNYLPGTVVASLLLSSTQPAVFKLLVEDVVQDHFKVEEESESSKMKGITISY